MKGIFKFMTAAAVSTAMVACTDDLSINSNADFQSDADLVGTLNDARPAFTRMGMSELGTAPWDGGSDWGLVWTKGDQVRVFTLDQLKYNYYALKDASANQPKGEFDIMSGTKLEGDKKFAITDAQFVYGVSATSDGEARLTYTIPYRWTASSIDSDGDGTTDVRKFPAPYWGRAEETSDGKINVGFSAMTAFLRIELDKLPAGTKKIVLTTHGNPYTIKDHDDTDAEYTAAADGFQLTDDAAILAAVTGKTETNYTWKDVDFNTSGANEPLSGTFNTLLKEGAALAPDNGINEAGLEEGTELVSRLVTRDEIIVDITATTPKVFYVPVIAQEYKNLHVIAAKAVSKYSYRYVGTELKIFNQEFERGHYYFLNMSLLNLGEVCAAELNAAIEAVNVDDHRTSILNVEKLVVKAKPGDAEKNTFVNALNAKLGTSYTWAQINAMPWDRIKVKGNGSLILNLNKIEDTPGAADGVSAVRSDKTNYGGTKTLFITDDKAITAATEADDMVTINLPHSLGDAPQTDADYQLWANLPTYNATIGSVVDGKNLTNLVAFVQTSKTNCVTGRNLLTNDGKDIMDGKDGALNMVTGVKDLNILAGSEGDIYINNIMEGADQLEINNQLNIQTTSDIDIRVDNALVKAINVVERTPADEVYIFSTGSSAFQKVEPITAVAANFASTIGDGSIPNDVTMHSYWTGAALNAEATNIKNYDNGNVFTTAQLASMGEKIGTSTTAEYSIPAELVNDMWLGANNPKYLWVGAKATIEGFKFDGRNVPLRKISMQTIADAAVAGTTFYVDDPHMCCTTCGWVPAVYGKTTGTGVTDIDAFGLIRSYEGTSATIENVNLSDVYFQTDKNIPNIGSIIGKVVAGQLTLTGNTVTNPKINVAGNNIGGLAGWVKLTDKLTVNNNLVSEDGEEVGSIQTSKEYVGGLIGKVEGAATSDFMGNAVKLRGDIDAKEYAGGLVGDLGATGVVTFGLGAKENRDLVKVANIKAKDGGFAGGFAGNIATTSANNPAIRVNFGEVTVSGEISAQDMYAGGLFGQVASGAKAAEIRQNSAAIKVGTIEAVEGFAGGETGYVKTGTLNIGRDEATQVTTIDVNKMSGAYAIGGIVGGNSNNSPVNVITGNQEPQKNASIDVNIKDWNNTKKDNFAAYFTEPDSKAQRAGTFSNVIGYLQGGALNITIEKDGEGKDLLTVVDVLDGAKKDALGYKCHRDENWNVLTGANFWGDTNGFVGYGKASYNINGTPVVAQAEDGFNLFKTDANYK